MKFIWRIIVGVQEMINTTRCNLRQRQPLDATCFLRRLSGCPAQNIEQLQTAANFSASRCCTSWPSMKNVVDDGRIGPQRKEYQARSQSNTMNSRCDWWHVLLKSIIPIVHLNLQQPHAPMKCIYWSQRSHFDPLKLYCHKSWTPVVSKCQHMLCIGCIWVLQNHQVQDCGGYSTGLYCLRTPQHLSNKHTTNLLDKWDSSCLRSFTW